MKTKLPTINKAMKTDSPFPSFARRFALLLGAVVLCHQASAFTFTWTGASAEPDNWYNITNWAPYGVPGGGDTIIVPSGTAPFPGGSYNDVRLTGGTIGGSLTIVGTLSWTSGSLAGNLTVANSGVVNLQGSGGWNVYGVIVNHGRVNWVAGSSTIWGWYGGRLDNQAGGLLDLQLDGTLSPSSGSPVINNAGTIRKSGGGGRTGLSVTLTNTGLMEVQSGTLSLPNDCSLTGGQLNVALRSTTSFGRIAFAGIAPLTGTLGATLADGFVPAAGDAFDVLSYGSRTGTFDLLDLPALGPPAEWAVTYGDKVTTISLVKGKPRLLLAKSGAQLAFTWSTNAGPGFLLQYATNLNPAIYWTPLTNEPTVVGNQFQILLPIGEGPGFYRLAK